MRRVIARFFAGILGLYVVFTTLLLSMRLAFAWCNWGNLRAAGYDLIGEAAWKGLRFDAATLAYVLAPAVALHYAAAATCWRPLRASLVAYLVILAVLIPLLCLADTQYFEETGKHMTYEATAYLNLDAVPIVRGAFELHPWLSSLSLAAVAIVGIGGFLGLRALVRYGLPEGAPPLPWPVVLTLPLWVAASICAGRGGFQSRPLRAGDASISANPYVNGLCLDPVFSVLQSTIAPSKPEFQFYDRASNTRLVRRLLLGDDQPPRDGRHPLLQTSSGTPEGNRWNVVIFALESWSGKDIGVLGGPPGVTPFFDDLSRQGAFFDRFYGNGIRTAAGMFSILCSFPNQPKRPIIDRAQIYSVHWRAISDILADAGYRNIFVHGKSLDFDHLSAFLKLIHFHRLIDEHDFGPGGDGGAGGAWGGYSDEQVMRRADEEFNAQGDRPFLGVIYTMDTHPPFVIPKDFPALFAPDSGSHRFLNALHYADHTLDVFFSLARRRAYFDRTIFVLVADHARTRDEFDYDSQHHIPLLIYAPGRVEPRVYHVVGSQLDIVPTILGLLELKTAHASWGQDLLTTPTERGLAVTIAGDDVRWHEGNYLLNDALGGPPLLFDLAADPRCRRNVWTEQTTLGRELQRKLRAYISLSQTLLFDDGVYPRQAAEAAGAAGR